ncbi:MAG: hypothetical protein JJU11_06085 [Candidatus Sumerlaeia bacterium]|nr:hypothetical protein [Candidatus Sumerlaeia bacterium]
MNFKYIPSPTIILALVLGVFFLIAGVGSWVPALVKDRYHEQFLPMMVYVFGEEAAVAPVLAVLSQVVIGIVEVVIGILFVWGVMDPKRRVLLLKGAYGLAILLMGTFMVVLFYLHLYDLPRWNQFPAILAMLLLGWWATIWEEERRSSR